MRALSTLLLVLVVVTGCGEDVVEEMTPVEGCPDVAALTGAEPDFPGGELLLGIDKIFPEYDGGAKLLMVDSRPPFDYNLDHIEGAVNVPYYDAEKCAPALPKDTWIITYCACPNQESKALAEDLQGEGFTKIHTLEEGYIVWKQRGYPISSD